MLDGRQVAAIAHCTAGDTEAAVQILHDSAPEEPWEYAVLACLIVLCLQQAGEPSGPARTSMLNRYQHLASDAALVVFHTRLGLSVLDAAGEIEATITRDIAAGLINQAADSADGYVVRDVLTHPGCPAALSTTQKHRLTALYTAAGLNGQQESTALQESLREALDTSQGVIELHLTAAMTR